MEWKVWKSRSANSENPGEIMGWILFKVSFSWCHKGICTVVNPIKNNESIFSIRSHVHGQLDPNLFIFGTTNDKVRRCETPHPLPKCSNGTVDTNEKNIKINWLWWERYRIITCAFFECVISLLSWKDCYWFNILKLTLQIEQQNKFCGIANRHC